MLQFYGSPMSSSGRTHWALEEAGVTYEYHRLPVGGSRAPEFLAIHAGGKIPVLVDGDLVLAESMAIDLYLAERYAPALFASDVAERAKIYEWSFWSTTNLQPELLRRMMHTRFLPEAARKPEVVAEATAAASRFLAYFEGAIGERAFLVGERFTLADLHVASILHLAARQELLGELPRTAAYVARQLARPAYARVLAAP